MTIRALVFDVFGTLVDWRSGIAREAERLLAAQAPGFDAGAFADAWRGRYQPSMETVRSGARPYVDLDTLHGESLPEVLSEFGIEVGGRCTPRFRSPEASFAESGLEKR